MEEKKKVKVSLWAKLKAQIRSMLALNLPPRKIALSATIGMFVGMTPLVGLQTYIAIGLAMLFRLPVLPAALCTHINNFLTMPFVYAAGIKLGLWVLKAELDVDIDWSNFKIAEIWDAGKSIILPLLVGSTIIGAAVSVLFYFLIYYIVKRYKKLHA